jgi:hypothetical protein
MRATFGVNAAITAAIVPFKIIALLRQSGVSVRCPADPQFAVINQAHVIHHHVMFHHGSQHVLSRTLFMFQNGSEHVPERLRTCSRTAQNIFIMFGGGSWSCFTRCQAHALQRFDRRAPAVFLCACCGCEVDVAMRVAAEWRVCGSCVLGW